MLPLVAPNEISSAQYQVELMQSAIQSQLSPTPVPPPNPTGNAQWLSSSLKYMGVDPGGFSRVVHTNIPYQEASVWYANGIWNMLVDSQGNSPVYYYSCSGDPTVNGNWGGKTAVWGNGVNGVSHACGEQSVQIFGNTLYATYIDITSSTMRMMTAPITTPTVWTLQTAPVLTTATVNTGLAAKSQIFLYNGTYYLYTPVSGGTAPGMYIFSSSTLTGTFTSTGVGPLTTLPGHAGTPYGPILDADGVTWILLQSAYTGSTVNGGWPVCVWRSTSTNPIADSWTQTDVMATPAIKQECTGIQDPTLVQTPQGNWIMFYTACNFRQGAGFYIASTPLLPTKMQWNGNAWIKSQSTYDNTRVAGYNEFWLTSFNAASFPSGRRTTPGRGSPATYYNSSGVRTTAAVYAARTANYNYNNGTSWVNGGALNEAQTGNYLPWSSVLSNVVWNYNQCTGGTDATTDPAGAVATMVTATSGSAVHRVAMATALTCYTPPGNGAWAYSIDVKAGTNPYVYLALQTTTGSFATVVFNLTGTAALAPTQTLVGAGSGTIVSATGQCLGAGGWFRINLVANVAISGVGTINIAFGHAGAATGNNISSSTGSVTFTAAGTETLYFSSPQLEQNTVSSYIPTIGPTMFKGPVAVRNADNTVANPAVCSAGTWALDTTTAGMVGTQRAYNSTSAKNDAFSLDVNMGDHNPIQWAGSNYTGATYHVRLLCHTGPANGIVNVSLVNIEQGSIWTPSSQWGNTCGNIDTYSVSDTYNVVFELPDITVDTLSPGRMALYFTVVDKNAASSSYLFGWHQISIFRVDI